jgi:anti-sigma regulatory factor (Ser/Thr protein kinase)
MLILKYGVPPKSEAVMVLQASEEQLVHVRNFINAELSRRKAPKHVFYEVDVFAEKLFVSMCRHAYPEATPENPGEMRIRFEYQSNPPTLNVSLSDNGIPHNPLAEIETPKAAANDESTGGEQDVPEATQIVDEMSYTRANGTNTVSFSKRW